MHISNALKKWLAAEITARPLKNGEFRHIPRMGSHYISKEHVWDTRLPLFAIELNGVTFRIFRSTEAPVDQ